MDFSHFSHFYSTARNNYLNRFVAYYTPQITWLNAQLYCRQHHTDLASVMTQSDVSLLQQILPPLNIYNGWIGLIRNSWMWSDGSSTSYLPWLSGQPDNYYYWEYCASEQGGLLSDEKCTQLHYFMCSVGECPVSTDSVQSLRRVDSVLEGVKTMQRG